MPRSTLYRHALRAGGALTAAGLLTLAGAGIASAHVSAHSPDQPTKGGDAEIVFRVPDEDDTAGTVRVQITFSTTSPLSNAVLRPVPGWTGTVTMATLAKPVTMGKETVTSAVSAITWVAQPGTRINPGEFQEFSFAVEGLPSNTDTLVMPAAQTYDTGKVVRWDQPTVEGQPEPDHPVPTLALADETPAAAPAPAATGDGAARWLGGIAVVLAALALAFGLGGFLRGRRTPAATPAPATPAQAATPAPAPEPAPEPTLAAEPAPVAEPEAAAEPRAETTAEPVEPSTDAVAEPAERGTPA